MKTVSALAFAAITTFASLSAHALTLSDQFGSASPVTAAQRVIVVDAGTRYVNVEHGDTVTLIVNGKSVTWTFDGLKPVIPLSTLFPSDAGAGNVEIFVASSVLS